MQYYNYFAWDPADTQTKHDSEQERSTTMLEKLAKLYANYMLQDVRSPIPHLAGPPGTNKSSSVKELAELAGVTLHTINVSRVSPLELEGVQMPNGTGEEMHLRMLHSTVWTSLKEGDIVLLDEFLRGFPEVYNGFLDIMTSREVAGFKLPKVFFIAASNSVVTYDSALEDRLLHIFVDDIRSSATARTEWKRTFISECGLLPELVNAPELEQMVASIVDPTYAILDRFKRSATAAGQSTGTSGYSMRNLKGQVQLRHVVSAELNNVLSVNNALAMRAGKPQYVVFAAANHAPQGYVDAARKALNLPGLSDQQRMNITVNFELLDLQLEATTK